MSRSRRSFVACMLLISSLGVSFLLGQKSTISAETLVQHILKDDGALLQENQTIYTKWRITQRVKPIHPERLVDPYHLAIEPEPAASTLYRWSERLQNGEVNWAVKSLGEDGTLLSAASFNGAVLNQYDRTTNLFISSSVNQQPDSISAANPQILGSQETKWGSTWIVSLSSDAVTADMSTGTPYYADLQPKTYERIALVLKDSFRVVQWTNQIHTMQNTTVSISTQTLDESTIRPSNTVNKAVFQVNIPSDATVVSSNEAQINHPTTEIQSPDSIDRLQKTVPFHLVLPDEKRSAIALQDITSRMSSSPAQRSEKRVFEIQDAAMQGEAVEVHYLSSNSSSACIETAYTCSKKTLVIIEGSAATLVPQMKRQRLIWDESRAIQLSIDGRAISGYVATGDTLQLYNQMIFLAEVNNTFMFILGQHYTEQEFLQTLESMHSIN